MLVLVAGLVAGCSREVAPRATPLDRPDVVLVTVDTLRLDHLGVMGDPRDPTPTLDALAGRGVLFRRAYSTTGWTAPAVASLLTGLYPAAHGVRSGVWSPRKERVLRQPRLDEALTTLPEALQACGYSTAAVVANWHIREELGHAQGFTGFHRFDEAPADDLLAPVIRAWTELPAEAPRFLWVHYLDPHAPYRAPTPWRTRFLGPESENALPEPPSQLSRHRMGRHREVLRELEGQARSQFVSTLDGLYTGEVAGSDHAVGELLERLAVDEHTVVVLASDHGEEFDDHGNLGHRRTLHAELVRVPLVVSWPAELPTGRVVDTPVSLVDLLPTVVDLAGGEVPASQGTSLVPLLRGGEQAGHPVFLEHTAGQTELRGVVHGRYRLVGSWDGRSGELGAVQLYDDAAELVPLADLASTRTDQAAGLGELLLGHLRASPTHQAEHVEVDDQELLEELGAMGYLD